MDILKLAKDKGFIGLFEKEWQYSSKENLRKEFILLQIQKWLREEYEIFISIIYIAPDTNKYSIRIDYNPLYIHNSHQYGWHETYNGALETGLIEGLKLVGK